MESGRKSNNVSSILKTTDTLKYKMILYSLFIGLISGGVIVVYRVLGKFLLEHFVGIYQYAKNNHLYIIPVFCLLILMALFVSFCVKQEPNISGSGIPQVEGIATRRIKVNWKKVLFYKFFGGIVSLAAGLSVGREGPSIQMGAAIGQGFAEKSGSMDHEQKYLLTSGASAGLVAAFNAPLSGVMFALEEVHKNFSPVVLTSAMVSAVTADIVTKSILGINPSLRFSMLHIMPIKYYWSLMLLGIIVGISSMIFNNGILKSKHLYKNMNIKIEYKIMMPFVIAGLIGMFFPVVIGGGHNLILNLGTMNASISVIFMILVLKYLFTFASFGSGVPGGIFFPLLAIGAVLGNLFGVICVKYFGISNEFLINFIILAMAGHFAAIVKAPITSIILIYEMTGSFEQLLPLSVVVFVALITSDLLSVEPVYEMLLNDILKNKNIDSYQGEINKKTLVELSVHMGSTVEGKYISEIDWPENCLVVSIYRGNSEILPRGKTMILAGDLLLIMVNQTESPKMLDYLTSITTN